jgi:heat shock protein HslJ
LILTAFLLASAEAAETADFVARGNEPGWLVRKTADGITFSPMDGPEVTISPLPQVQETDGVAIYQTMGGGENFKLTITQEVCVDTMSGMSYPATVSVETGRKRFAGCGGEPAALLRGDWTVEQIDGKPLVEGSNVTLDFGTGGKVSGSASCNRYFGGYTLTGEGLTFSQVGSTKMMCEQPLMDQEGLFLKSLEAVARFEIGPDGSLALKTDDGRSVTARRKG